MLGVKQADEWIFNFNIGNIMHLTPLEFDDLNRSNVNVVLELSKDQMLDKMLLLIASYFCTGTELRFLSCKDAKTFEKKDGEMWHAKAMHIASTFLPPDCPLTNHVISSYIKHYLQEKMEWRQVVQNNPDDITNNNQASTTDSLGGRFIS